MEIEFIIAVKIYVSISNTNDTFIRFCVFDGNNRQAFAGRTYASTAVKG